MAQVCRGRPRATARPCRKAVYSDSPAASATAASSASSLLRLRLQLLGGWRLTTLTTNRSGSEIRLTPAGGAICPAVSWVPSSALPDGHGQLLGNRQRLGLDLDAVIGLLGDQGVRSAWPSTTTRLRRRPSRHGARPVGRHAGWCGGSDGYEVPCASCSLPAIGSTRWYRMPQVRPHSRVRQLQVLWRGHTAQRVACP